MLTIVIPYKNNGLLLIEHPGLLLLENCPFSDASYNISLHVVTYTARKPEQLHFQFVESFPQLHSVNTGNILYKY
jgi:hypothetical protein